MHGVRFWVTLLAPPWRFSTFWRKKWQFSSNCLRGGGDWHLLRGVLRSLRRKRFRLVSEQKKTEERDFRFWPRGKWNESQKMKEGRGEGRKRLQTSPSILKTCVRQRTQRVIGSASRTILICVDQRFVSYWEVMYGTWHASSCGRCLFYPPMQEHFL